MPKKSCLVVLPSIFFLLLCSSLAIGSENSYGPVPEVHFFDPGEIHLLAEGDLPSDDLPETPEPSSEKEPIYRGPFDRPWSVMYYHGVGTSTDMGQNLIFDIDWEDSQFTGLAFNRVIFPFWWFFTFELEGQVLKHFEKQTHWEYNGLFMVRFHPFILDEYLDIDFAVGEGLSYASSLPIIEQEQHPNGDTAHLLNYIVFEVAFTLPQFRSWTVVTRIHHRSGVFGLFNGASGGSNFYATGLRYHF